MNLVQNSIYSPEIFLAENIFIPEMISNIIECWNNSVAQNPSASTLLISPEV